MYIVNSKKFFYNFGYRIGGLYWLAKQLSLYDYIDNTLKNLVTCEVEIKAEEDNIQKAILHMDILHKDF
ncbi:hypothetical protein [Clostridium tetani]|uniref:hypothetical protein n=1 Tax=Clostridium tetani TaxID=1513 RepID=UPI001FB09AA3|nr:hypothetical protein [Clostridium tetani]